MLTKNKDRILHLKQTLQINAKLLSLDLKIDSLAIKCKSLQKKNAKLLNLALKIKKSCN